MEELRLPLLSGSDRGVYPANRHCPVCAGAFAGGTAYMLGGALMLSEDGQDSVQCERLTAFLHVGFHGKDPEMRDSGDLLVVDDLIAGQFDLRWCSIQCMRRWLMQLLNKLEGSIGGENENAQP